MRGRLIEFGILWEAHFTSGIIDKAGLLEIVDRSGGIQLLELLLTDVSLVAKRQLAVC